MAFLFRSVGRLFAVLMQLAACSTAFYLLVINVAMAQADDVEERIWNSDYRSGRHFYLVHGSMVYGHEFGFFKSGGDCQLDVIWLSISTYDETVAEFEGQHIDVEIRVDDAAPVGVTLPILAVEGLGFMQILIMTNWAASSALIDDLARGSEVEISVSEEDPIFSRLDIPGDFYSLENFRKSRLAATAACRDSDALGNIGP